MTNTLTAEQIAQLLEAAEKTMGGGAGHYLQIRDLFAENAKNSLPVSGEAWTDEQISKLGPWQRVMDKDGLDRYRDVAKSMKGHDMAPVNGNSLYRLIGLIDALMAVIPSPLTNEPVGVTTRWQHRKRGTVYTEIGRGLLQCAANPALDDQPVVIYQGEDGKLWVRGVSEFEDGRFYRLSAAIGERG